MAGTDTIDDADLYLSFAQELVDAVKPVVLSYFRTPLDVVLKSDESPVTIADRTIERHLRERIEARFPDHGIFGEEMGIKPGNGLTWIIDPIDGTKSFITRVPVVRHLDLVGPRWTTFLWPDRYPHHRRTLDRKTRPVVVRRQARADQRLRNHRRCSLLHHLAGHVYGR